MGVLLQYESVPSYSLTSLVMTKWHMIEIPQPLLREILKEPLLISYMKGRSLKDILMGERKKQWLKHERGSRAGLSSPFFMQCTEDGKDFRTQPWTCPFFPLRLLFDLYSYIE